MPMRVLCRTGLQALAIAVVAAPAVAVAQQPPPPPPASTAAPTSTSTLPPPPPPAGAQPPPGYGPPPPGYGPPPPGYGPPAYYYPPGGPVGPPEMAYVEGQPVPAGYHVEHRGRRKLIVAGVSIFGGCYLASAVVGGFAVSEGDNTSDELGALLIPIAGPFITIGTSHLRFGDEQDNGGIFLLIIDGVAQIAGVTLAVIGLSASDTPYLVRNDRGKEDSKAPPSLVPQVMVSGRAGALRWQF
jgi:hypothetical protein